ncbi:MAG: hypothetical protein Q9169_004224 [Polycauliona sp. 2 TL-2023]
MDFAYLISQIFSARKAFSDMVHVIRADKSSYLHARRFMKLEGASSNTSAMCSGCFVLSLQVSTQDKGLWMAGTGGSDLLLAPKTRKWSRQGIHEQHFQLSFRKECCRMMLTAAHTVHGMGDKMTRNDICVLENGQTFSIGACTYIRGCSLTTPHAPTAKPLVTIGDFRCSPEGFAAGGYGEVSAGWAKDGGQVAIKRLLKPTSSAARQHRKLMDRIKHPNIVELAALIEDYHPSIYYPYSPLGEGTLADAMKTHTFDFAAKCGIFRDVVLALVYLHHELGMMHRDIKPQNIGVMCYNNPWAFVLHLDTLTRSREVGGLVGSRAWIAPEVLAREYELLKENMPEGHNGLYNRSVDLWALGLCIYAVEKGGFTQWITFDDDPIHNDLAMSAGILDNCVTRERWEGLHLVRLTNWDKDERGNAQDALKELEDLTSSCGKGTLTVTTGT